MVAGSAVLVKQAHPELSAREIKALLVTSAYPDVLSNVLIFGGTKLPITRQGGGEVRVMQAITALAAAWDTQTLQPSLSFGFLDAANRALSVTRHITVKNYTDAAITYKVTSTFRYQDDADTEAVSVAFTDAKTADTEVTVPAGGMVNIPVHIGVVTPNLRPWEMNSGSKGASGATLTKFEYDGFVWFDNVATTEDDASMMHMAWHVLPRLGGNMVLPSGANVVTGGEYMGLPAGTLPLANDGAGPVFIDVYSLLGTSPNQPEGEWGMQSPIIDLKNFGVQTYPVSGESGVCDVDDSFVMSFAINTWERTAHADYPAEFDVYLDTNQDGTPDYVVWNGDLGLASGTTDGRNVTWVTNLATKSSSAWFYTTHSTNTANFVLTFCGEQVGMNADNFYQMMDVSVYAFDDYFTGNLTDMIEGMVAAPLGERYGGIINDGYGWGDLAGGVFTPYTTLTVVDWGTAGTNPFELGLLLVNTGVRGTVMSGSPRGNEATVINVNP